jgi:uncharacterized membrane protein YhaH (DUF805 family)
MNILQSAEQCVIKKYATFEGRASRSEYWWFTLSSQIVIYGSAFISTSMDNYILYAIVFLGLLLPGISVLVRRLHDINKSGWHYWWILTGIGLFLLIYWFCQKSNESKNDYGPPPSK